MILNLIDKLIKNEKNVSYLIGGLLAITIVILLFFATKKKKFETSDVACIGIFTAFSIVLYFVKFNLPFIFPSFLEINFSLLPIIISDMIPAIMNKASEDTNTASKIKCYVFINDLRIERHMNHPLDKEQKCRNGN